MKLPLKKIEKISKIIVSVLLVIGIISSSFGIGILAIGDFNKKDPKATVAEVEENQGENQNNSSGVATVDPTKDYSDLKNEACLQDDVEVLTKAESDEINRAITSVKCEESYNDNYITISLAGDEIPEGLSDLSYGDIFYIQGDENSPLGGDRIFALDYCYSYQDEVVITVTEPYFEDVFDSLEYFASDALTEENFVNAYYAEGVTSYFGNVDETFQNVAKTEDLNPEITMLSSSSQGNYMTTANQISSQEGDLIVSINFDLKKIIEKDDGDDEDDEGDEDFFNVDTDFKLTGSFGIRDLAAYIVCDMPSKFQIDDLFLGVRGVTFVDVELSAGVEASANMPATKKNLGKLVSLEGLNEKLLPIAAFEFQGTTPVYITNSAFETGKEKIIPSLYLLIYTDWEGNISLELTGKFSYSNAFNNGLSVYKDGELNLSFEDYPYENAYDSSAEDGVVWELALALEAESDLTLMGSSVLFYIAGINIGEVSIARVGIEAECDLSISANSKDGIHLLESDETAFYIRGYLKFIEVKVKLKAQGKSFLEWLSIDVDFEFALLDFTLFSQGKMPDKFRPVVPVSTMKRPSEFESAITLVFDDSGSMESTIDSGQTKLEAAKAAASTIVTTSESWTKKYNANYGIGVVRFSDYAETVALPHIDYKFINDCIASINDGGGTNIHAGIDTGVDQLKNTKTENKIIILMTDGQDSNDSKTLESARKAAEENIKIYTIGFGYDVDNELLEEIATITGGEYRFADTENIMSIIASFLYAQQSSNGEVLVDFESTVSQGESSEKVSFNVEDPSGDLLVTTVWPGSFLDTVLVDPAGRKVDDEYPDAEIDKSTIPTTIFIKDPLPGKWQMHVVGVETSYDDEPFYSIVTFRENDTEIVKANKEMTLLEKSAAYALPIGIVLTLVSLMLLITICKNSKKQKEEQ